MTQDRGIATAMTTATATATGAGSGAAEKKTSIRAVEAQDPGMRKRTCETDEWISIDGTVVPRNSRSTQGVSLQ